jgi:hypothetical protein
MTKTFVLRGGPLSPECESESLQTRSVQPAGQGGCETTSNSPSVPGESEEFVSPYPGFLPPGPHDGIEPQPPVVLFFWTCVGVALMALFLITLFLADG